jgi:hypothetical protein
MVFLNRNGDCRRAREHTRTRFWYTRLVQYETVGDVRAHNLEIAIEQLTHVSQFLCHCSH